MRKKLLASITGAALVLGLTAGCQAAPPDITPNQASAFQSQVLAITTAVADGSYAAALDALTTLETELDAAAAEGEISFARHQRVEAALAVVRADVQTAIDALQPDPEPAPVETTDPDDDDDEEEVAPPDTETDAEKKTREAAEKKAADEAKKAAEELKKAEKKAADEAKKKAEEAKKQAEKDAKEKGPKEKGPGND